MEVRRWPDWVPGVSEVRATTDRLGPTTTGALRVGRLWLPFSVRRFSHQQGFSLWIAGVPGVAVAVDGARFTLRGLPSTRAALETALQAR